MVKKIALIGFLVVIACGIGGYLYLFWGRTVNRAPVRVILKEDLSGKELADKLVEKGILNSVNDFLDPVNDKSFSVDVFAGGKYVIEKRTSIDELITGFRKDDNGVGNAELLVNVDFNRCRDIEDVGLNISKCIAADSTSIVDYILNSETLSKYGFTAEQVPALFLPKQYQMEFDTDAEEFVAFMAKEFQAFWNEERMAKIKKIGLNTPSQVVTIASIVYSEQSKMSEEWPIIAKLYLNRVNQGIRLQSDPTFKFCWGDKLDGVERLLNVHRDIDCPYNTYKINGLPPGPICLVPAEVIDAVLNPADVDYIFMCGKPGGSGHNFALTNEEHDKNATEYRVWLKAYLENKK
jgi:peptidoglycan lytic transglycosylase G